MSQKILPIGAPPIIGYLHHAYPLSILSQNNSFLPWFFSHYIQLFCPLDISDGPDPARKRKFNFYRPPNCDYTCSPRLEMTYISRRIIDKNNLIAFIRDTIEQNEYVQICIDEYYIPEKSVYRKRHLIHEILICGYDDISSQTTTLGFNRQGDFAPSKVSYENLIRAYSDLNLTNHYDQAGICAFRYNSQPNCDFDKNLLTESLADYLLSSNTSERFRMLAPPIDGVFGLNVYPCLINQCKALLSHPEWFDIRPLHILWEHKKCMLNRLQFMETSYYLNATASFSLSYRDIEKQAQILRMMMLKLRTTKNSAILIRIIDGLEKMACNEKNLLSSVLNMLDPSYLNQSNTK